MKILYRFCVRNRKEPPVSLGDSSAMYQSFAGSTIQDDEGLQRQRCIRRTNPDEVMMASDIA